jgi:hypothetical protein
VDQPGAPGILIALPGGDTGADLGRRYRLRSYEGPAPEAMARDFLAGFDQNFPGARQAYNGRTGPTTPGQPGIRTSGARTPTSSPLPEKGEQWQLSTTWDP